MQKMAQTGNTYYIFEESGVGMSFNNVGIHVGDVNMSGMMFSLRNITDVQVISILGTPGKSCCDVYFDGQSGLSNMDCSEVISKARRMSNLMAVPFRVKRDSNEGLLQVILVARPNCISREYIEKTLGVSQWRITK